MLHFHDRARHHQAPAANKDANALAREAADTFARTFVCDKDKPRPFGTTSEWMEQVIGVKRGEEPRR